MKKSLWLCWRLGTLRLSWITYAVVFDFISCKLTINKLLLKGCGINYKNLKSLSETDYATLLMNDYSKLGAMITFRDFHKEWKISVVSSMKFYTNSGNLAYSWHFFIDIPLNTVGRTLLVFYREVDSDVVIFPS